MAEILKIFESWIIDNKMLSLPIMIGIFVYMIIILIRFNNIDDFLIELVGIILFGTSLLWEECFWNNDSLLIKLAPVFVYIFLGAVILYIEIDIRTNLESVLFAVAIMGLVSLILSTSKPEERLINTLSDVTTEVFEDTIEKSN